MHWLCRLGFHRWVELDYPGSWRVAVDRCSRPGCRASRTIILD